MKKKIPNSAKFSLQKTLVLPLQVNESERLKGGSIYPATPPPQIVTPTITKPGGSFLCP